MMGIEHCSIRMREAARLAGGKSKLLNVECFSRLLDTGIASRLKLQPPDALASKRTT
jgi:hypothetical protein